MHVTSHSGITEVLAAPGLPRRRHCWRSWPRVRSRHRPPTRNWSATWQGLTRAASTSSIGWCIRCWKRNAWSRCCECGHTTSSSQQLVQADTASWPGLAEKGVSHEGLLQGLPRRCGAGPPRNPEGLPRSCPRLLPLAVLGHRQGDPAGQHQTFEAPTVAGAIGPPPGRGEWLFVPWIVCPRRQRGRHRLRAAQKGRPSLTGLSWIPEGTGPSSPERFRPVFRPCRFFSDAATIPGRVLGTG